MSFGGPVAHIGYFRRELVERLRWVTAEEYAGWVALCQFLPGPASSQLGFCLGMQRSGLMGAAAAFAGFTLPSAVVMAGLGVAMAGWVPGWLDGVVHGLKLVAVAVVLHGVLAMGRSLGRDGLRMGVAIGVGLASLVWREAWVQPVLMLGAGLLGGWQTETGTGWKVPVVQLGYGRLTGGLFLAGYGLLVASGGLGGLMGDGVGMLAGYFRAGGLVFGGGHVVLPLLERAVVGPGWLTPDAFLAGYGAAQAMPGPMFTLAAFLGARMPHPMGGFPGAIAGCTAVFLPGLLLVAGVLPFWQRWSSGATVGRMMSGVNAGVVGLLGAALYDPVWTGAVKEWPDAVVALLGFAALQSGRVPVLAVVGGCVVAGMLQR
jgi:chromate transporter